MPTLLHSLPISPTGQRFDVGTDSVRFKAFQPVVWVSIAPSVRTHLPDRVRRFPAVLDTGNNFTFCLSERHLHEWAGYSLRDWMDFRTRGVRLYGSPVPCLKFNVWLYSNVPGRLAIHPRRRPTALPITHGIAIYPEGAPNLPRLPVLGMRALHLNRLQLHLDAGRLSMSLRGESCWQRWFGSRTASQ